jgi:hypothetical protein
MDINPITITTKIAQWLKVQHKQAVGLVFTMAEIVEQLKMVHLATPALTDKKIILTERGVIVKGMVEHLGVAITVVAVAELEVAKRQAVHQVAVHHLYQE